MLVRSAMFACAAAMMAFAAPASAEEGRCETTSMRVYFAPGSATLDETAMEVLAAAERRVAGCDYAELRMTMEAGQPRARQRSEAIMAAADGRAWDEVRIEWSMLQRAAMRGGPDYVEVTFSAEPMDAPAAPAAEAGV